MTHELLRASRTPPIDALATALINDLTEVRQPLTLVLDDHHTVQVSILHRRARRSPTLHRSENRV